MDLLDKVCEFINLVEKDYFGLTYKDREGYTVWMEVEKRISKQLKSMLYLFDSMDSQFT
jgi:erythrocyte membrane protein band 4.1